MIKQGKVLKVLYRFISEDGPGIKLLMKINDREVEVDSYDENFPNGLLAPSSVLDRKVIGVIVKPPTDAEPFLTYEVLSWNHQHSFLREYVSNGLISSISNGFLREINWEEDTSTAYQGDWSVKERLEKLFKKNDDDLDIQGELPLK